MLPKTNPAKSFNRFTGTDQRNQFMFPEILTHIQSSYITDESQHKDKDDPKIPFSIIRKEIK